MITSLDILWASLAVLGTLLSAIAAGCEMGIYSINRVRLSLRTATGERRAHILSGELAQGGALIAVTLICYNLFAFLGALGTTTLLQEAGLTEWQIVALNVAVLGPILFVIQDTMPKEILRIEADRLMYALAPALKGTRLVLTFTGILPLVRLISRGITRLIPGEGEEEAVAGARQRMAMLLKEGARHGALSEAQASMVDRALGLREEQVGDVMVPWVRVRTVRLDTDPVRLLAFAREHALSRFPVVDARGGVVGVLEHLDIVLDPGAPPARLMKPALKVSPSLSVRDGLLALREHDARLAVVVEGDRPIGIATGKDLAEPLTGELKAF